MKKDDWTFREKKMVNELGRVGCIRHVTDAVISQIDMAHEATTQENHRFVPGDLDMAMLVRGLPALGVKVRAHKIPMGYERIPGESGVIFCDIAGIMRPTDLQDAPFMLDMRRHIEWARSLGGRHIMSAEEVLYVLARSALEFQRLPFASGWVRARNKVKGDECVVIAYSAEHGGLEVGLTDEATRKPTLGAVPDVFRKAA